MSRPKNDWARVSNCPGGPGTAPGNKYNFTKYLKKIGDFVESHPMTNDDCLKLKYAAFIWAWRHRCRITTERFYYPEGIALRIEVVSHTRNERNK